MIGVVSPDYTTKLNYQAGKLISIDTRDGKTSFTYNQNGLISKVVDVTGKSYGYTYYSEKPYKVMKVVEYGLNNVEGASFTLKYGFNTTSIVDYKGRVTTLVYNSNGNVISSNSLTTGEDIDSAYSVVKQYGEDDNKNKLLSNTIPVRYVKNYLTNSSFEKSTTSFSGSGLSISFDSEKYFTGKQSLKVVNSSTSKNALSLNATVGKGKHYTFSGYFVSDKDFSISLSYTDSNGNVVESIQNVDSSDEFVRNDVTVFYDNNANGNLMVKIYVDSDTTLYIDDVQLEEGEVANNYNMIENSDFSLGYSDWTLDGFVLDTNDEDGNQASIDVSKVFEIVSFNNNKNKALRVKMDPKNSTNFKRNINASGKKGDLYHLSFWYKNEGIEPDDMFVGNSATLFFKPVNYEDSLMCVMPGSSFPPNQGIWQYFSYKFIAEFDYDGLTLMFNQGRNANDFYITNLCLYKDLASNFYDYDGHGNVVGIKDVNREESAFNYDENNQLINATTPGGKNFSFEYDNVKTDRVLSSISSMGISNKVEYDDNNNPVLTRVAFKNKDISMDNVYKIKDNNNKYLKVVGSEVFVNANTSDEDIDGDSFKIRSEADGRVKIVYNKDREYVLKKRPNGVVELVLEHEDNRNPDMEKYVKASNYLLVRNRNGSFHVVFDKSKEELVNSYDNTGYDYLRVLDGKLSYSKYVDGDTSFDFYFQLDEESSDKTLYKIRSKGTNKYLSSYGKVLKVREDTCSNTLWKLKREVDGETKITYDLLGDYYLTCIVDVACLGKDGNGNLLVLEKRENGSYYIRTRLPQDELTDEVIKELENGVEYDENGNLIDPGTPSYLKDARYLRVVGEDVCFSQLEPGDPSFEFYFEVKEEEFIETRATYTDDGRFVTSVTDSNFNKTMYDTDSVTGLLKSSTNSKGQVTNYTYNDKNQITSVTSGEKSVSYSYNSNNLLDKISQGTKEYKLTYDAFLNAKTVGIGEDIILSSNEYEEKNGNLIKTTYGNGDSISFSYDEFDRIIKTTKMDDSYSYKYDNNGDIVKMLSNNHLYKYSYDIGKRLNEYRCDNFKINYTYDSNDNVIGKRYKLNNRVNKIENTLNKDDLLVNTKLDDLKIDYTYDNLGRLVKKTALGGQVTEYEYVKNGKRTSELVKSLKNGNNKYSYTYDELNNITEIYYNDELVNKYSYDEYNELIEEVDYQKNIRLQYVYDNSGNLLTKRMTNLENGAILNIDSYLYANLDWEDQLTSFNGKEITYDAIGNPLTIGSDVELTWVNGRSLKSYSDTSKSLNVSYKYNNDGIREEKTVNGSTTKYYLEGTSIVYEEKGTRTIYYLYDATGVIGLRYDNNTYLFEKSLQGDIIGIVDSNNERVATYEYDSWGKVLSTKDKEGNEISNQNHVGIINPFRYRGYYYDTETGLYYLNSRYYNPKWCRFINADGIIGANQDIFSYNLYLYVSNNPIIQNDATGYGLFKKIRGVFMCVRIKIQEFKTTITNAVNDVIGKIISVDYTRTKTKKEKKGGYDALASVSIGASESSTKTILGNKNSILKININNNDDDILKSNISTSISVGNLNLSKDYGFSHGESYSLSLGDRKIGYSYSIGLDGLSHTFTSGTDDNLYYTQLAFGYPVIFAVAFAIPSMKKLPIPDVRTHIHKTGQVVGSF